RRLDHRVVERPHAAGAIGSEQLDLRMVDAMARDEGRRAHRTAQEGDDRVATLERVAPAAVGRRRVLAQAVGQLVPALLVEAAQVAVFESFDRFELVQIVHGPSSFAGDAGGYARGRAAAGASEPGAAGPAPARAIA